MRHIYVLGLIAALGVLPAFAAETHPIAIYADADDPLLYVSIEIPDSDKVDAPGNAIRRVRCEFGDDRRATSQLLYPVTVSTIDDDGQPVLRLVARWPQSDTYDTPRPATLSIDYPAQRRANVSWKLHLEPVSGGPELAPIWRQHFEIQLKERCQKLSTNELDLLLYRRFFGSFPDLDTKRNQRQQELDLLWNLMGVHRMATTLPQSASTHVELEARILDPPENFLSATTDQVGQASDVSASDPARWIPRTCATIQFPSLTLFHTSATELGELIDQWSPGTWPQPASTLINQELNALGLDQPTVATLEATGPIRVAVAVWDPFFASGSNALVVLQAEGELPIPANARHAHRSEDGHTLVLSSSQTFLDAALAAYADGTGLAFEADYHEAIRNLAVRTDHAEAGFVHLGKAWLANFFSPRWQIIDERRRTLDTRIRLTELLRLIHSAEKRQMELTPLHELGTDPYLDAEFLSWMYMDLEQQEDGSIAHVKLNSIGNHPSIADMPFDKVTASEIERYQQLGKLFKNRQLQSDPVSIRAELSATGELRLRTRVGTKGSYNDLMMIRSFLLNPKQAHQIETTRSSAMGLSINLDGKAIAGFVPGLPDITNAQISYDDFGPMSFSSLSWLAPPPQLDNLSFLSIPAIAILPEEASRGSLYFLNFPWNEKPDEPEIYLLNTRNTKIWGWRSADRTRMAAALQPALLRELREQGLTQRAASIPSDLCIWIDLKKAYLMHNKILQLAVKNRSLADWQRRSRLHHINQALGLPVNHIKAHWTGRHVFATQQLSAAVKPNYLPATLMPGDQANGYAANAASHFDDLPWLLRDCEHIEIFMSLHDAHLETELKIRFKAQRMANWQQTLGISPKPQQQVFDSDF